MTGGGSAGVESTGVGSAGDGSVEAGSVEAGVPCRVLMVDDEPDLEPLVLRSMRREIRAKQYEFMFALDGLEALERLETTPRVDVVVSDINMPRMDGLALLERVARERPDISCIIVSAYGDMKNIRTAMNRGAFDFVTKPLDFEDFRITVKRTWEHVAERRQTNLDRTRLALIQQDLRTAHNMQQSILPETFPSTPQYEIHGSMIPAQDVGGDFYDMINLTGGRIGIAVADVSGKGIPAALFMMSSRTILKGTAIGMGEPGPVLGEVNRMLQEGNRTRTFVTVFYGVYDPAAGTLVYANGGHCPPLLLGPDGSGTMLPTTRGIALGLTSRAEYRQELVRIPPGHTLVVYSDGVSEAMNERNEELGETGLADELSRERPQGARETVDAVLRAVADFSTNTAQFDDITCLALHRKDGP